MENDSNNIFTIAEDAVAIYSSLNVIIVKRFPRYDKPSSDILGIKSQISKYANNVYDQLWLKQGSPSRIHVIDLELGSDKYAHLKNIIFGNVNSTNYDGIHLVGEGASRHFTYRAVQQISRIITKPLQSATLSAPSQARRSRNLSEKWRQDHNNCEQTRYQRSQARRNHNLSEKLRQDHTDCEQARYKRSQVARDSQRISQQVRTYADVVANNDYNYSVPTQNYYTPLNY